MQQVFEVLRAHNNNQPSALALSCDGVEFEYKKLFETTEQRLSALKKAGVTEGHVVFVTTGRGLNYWQDMLAVWSLGAVAVPIDCKTEWLVLDVYIKKAQPHFVLGTPPHLNKLAIASQEDDIFQLVCNADRSDQSNDLAAIYFTSGSTGQPKGVMLKGSAVWGNAQAVTNIIPIKPSDRLLVPVPFHFTSTICHFLASIITGSTLVLTENKVLFKDVIELVNSFSITALGGAPLHLKWLLECENSIASTLRWVMSSGDILPIETIEGFAEKLPHVEIITVYGLTEVGGRLTILTNDELLNHKGSVGRAMPGMQVATINEQGQLQELGLEGEIVVSGDFLFSGYMRDGEKNKKSFLGDKFKTGDVGKVTTEGYVYLLGRNDDVFKVGGKKVSAAWITKELIKTNFFADVAVIGKEFSGFGNIPWACYVLKEGAEFSRLKLTSALRQQLPLNHIPQQYVEVPYIPRTGSGKVNRRELRAMIDEKHT